MKEAATHRKGIAGGLSFIDHHLAGLAISIANQLHELLIEITRFWALVQFRMRPMLLHIG